MSDDDKVFHLAWTAEVAQRDIKKRTDSWKAELEALLKVHKIKLVKDALISVLGFNPSTGLYAVSLQAVTPSSADWHRLEERENRRHNRQSLDREIGLLNQSHDQLTVLHAEAAKLDRLEQEFPIEFSHEFLIARRGS